MSESFVHDRCSFADVKMGERLDGTQETEDALNAVSDYKVDSNLQLSVIDSAHLLINLLQLRPVPVEIGDI